MPLVRIISDPADLSAYDEHRTDDLLGLLRGLYPDWPPTARVYRGQVSLANDVTPSTEEQVEILGAAEPDELFHVVVYPGDPITALVTVVVTLALTAAVLLFLSPKVPSLSNDSQSSNNTLGERVNKPRPNNRIEDIFGEVVSVPTLIAVPLLTFENNLEVEHCLMCVGRGAYDISEVLDGDTPIASIAGAAVAFYGPRTRPGNGQPFLKVGADITQAPVNVGRSNEVNGQILRMPNDGVLTGKTDITFTGPDTITHSATDYSFTDSFAPDAQVTITGSSGGYDGTYQMLAVSDVKITLANPGATNNAWKALGTGSAPQTNAVKLTATGTPMVGPFKVDHDGATELVFNFVAPQGVYRLNEQGKNRDRAVVINVQVQPTDRMGNPQGAAVGSSITISGNGNDRRPKGATLRVPVPAGRFYNVTVMRITGPFADTDETVVDEIRWRDLFSTSPIPGPDYGDVTTLQSRTYATAGATSVKERKINCRAVRRVRGRVRRAGDRAFDLLVSPQQGVTVRRAGPGTRIDATGARVSEAADVARLDYDPRSLAPRGLLLEPASTNLLYPSNDFSNASWVLTNLTSAGTNAVRETTTSGPHVLTNTRANCQAGTTYTYSIEAGEVPSGPKRYLMLHLRSQVFGTDLYALFDAATGAVLASTAGLAAGSSAAPEGRWLCWATAKATASGIVSSRAFLRNQPSISAGSYAGDTTAGMQLANAQIEPAAGATSRITTVAAAASRAGDTLLLDVMEPGYAGSRQVSLLRDDGTTQSIAGAADAGVVTLAGDGLNRYAIARATVPDVPGAGQYDPILSNALTASRSAADILVHMALDPFIGARTEDEIDIEQVYDTIDEVRAYFGFDNAGEFSATFDQDDLSFEEMAQAVAQAVFCTAYRQGAKLRLFFERSTTDSVLLFNHRNKAPRSESRGVKFGRLNDYDGVELDYVSGDDGAKLTTYIPADQSATKPKKIEVIGIVDRRGDGAVPHLHASRAWNKIQYQNTTTEFESVGEASELVLTQRIEVSDNTKSDVIEGEVRGQDGLVLTLSQPFVPADGVTYAMHLQLPSGRVQVLGVTGTADPMRCVLAGAPDEALDTSDEVWALPVYQIVAPGGRPSAFLVSERGAYNGKTLSVQAINYDERYYANDGDYR